MNKPTGGEAVASQRGGAQKRQAESLDYTRIVQKQSPAVPVMLTKEPDSIPRWSVTQARPVRELSKSVTLAIFKLLVEADDAVTVRRFIASASISIGAVEQLLASTNPNYTPEEITAAVNDILADRIHSADFCSCRPKGTNK